MLHDRYNLYDVDMSFSSLRSVLNPQSSLEARCYVAILYGFEGGFNLLVLVVVTFYEGEHVFDRVEPRGIWGCVQEVPSSGVSKLFNCFGMMKADIVQKKDGPWLQFQPLQKT
jgi:hypothetical protein